MVLLKPGLCLLVNDFHNNTGGKIVPNEEDISFFTFGYILQLNDEA